MIILGISTFQILYTNDLHSRLEQWPKVISLLNEKRSTFKKDGQQVLVFDIGDHADRVNPLTEASLGKANVKLMNEAIFDAVTIGNNEGITLSKEALIELYDEANFPVLVANLFDEDGTRPTWVKPYQIFQLSNELKIGVIGVTIAFKPFYEALNWMIKDPFDILPSLVKEVRTKSDIVILLSHLGVNFDEEIAQQIEGIDIILGGHTHNVLEQGLKINNTIIHQAGKFGSFVGHLTLTYDDKKKRLVNFNATCLAVNNYAPCEETSAILTLLKKSMQTILAEEVTIIKEDLFISWEKPSLFASVLATALKDWCKGEIGMVNSGILLEGLQKGPITKEDLHRVCPHPINPCKIEVSGQVLKETIHYSLSDEMTFKKIRGYGFRGKVMGLMVFDGVTYETIKLSDGLNHIRNIKVNGEEIENDRIYKVATIDMFAFSNLYPGLAAAKVKKYYLPELLRDLLAWKLKGNVR